MEPCEKGCGRKARNQKEGRWICSTCLADEKRQAREHVRAAERAEREREWERRQAMWERRDRSLDVVGESRRLGALHAAIRRRNDGQLPESGDLEVDAVLKPEPTNRADPNAVGVYIDDALVGYIPRDMTHVYRQIEAAAKKQAPTSGRWIKKRARLIGVKTDAIVGWSRPEVVGVSLVGIDIESGSANVEPIYS